MRETWLRVTAGIIALTGVAIAFVWPSSCSNIGHYIPIEGCDSHLIARIAIAGLSVAAAAAVLALSARVGHAARRR